VNSVCRVVLFKLIFELIFAVKEDQL